MRTVSMRTKQHLAARANEMHNWELERTKDAMVEQSMDYADKQETLMFSSLSSMAVSTCPNYAELCMIRAMLQMRLRAQCECFVMTVGVLCTVRRNGGG